MNGIDDIDKEIQISEADLEYVDSWFNYESV